MFFITFSCESGYNLLPLGVMDSFGMSPSGMGPGGMGGMGGMVGYPQPPINQKGRCVLCPPNTLPQNMPQNGDTKVVCM